MSSAEKSKRGTDFTFYKDDDKSEGEFINAKGCKIYCRYWTKDLKDPKALLFMCHGAAEHCYDYGVLAERGKLGEKGFFVFGHDHQGHGKSGGTKMDITDFRDYARDVFDHVDKVKESFPGLPVFILGHSMGGIVSIIAGLDRPNYFAGQVLVAPVVTPNQDTVGPVKIFFGKLIARMLPQFPVFSLDSGGMSRDEEVVKNYREDPLNYHGSMKARWSLCLLHTMQEVESKLKTIEWPFLVLHGTRDTLVNCHGSEDLYRESPSKDKQIKIYEGYYHQLHKEIEPCGEEIRNEISSWLVKHLP